MLRDRTWNLKYTLDDGDLVKLFYIPALEAAERYDRLTGYFNARALTLAARGIEGLVRNGGRMRLVAGCTLEPPEIEAIEKGEQLRDLVEQHLASLPLAPPGAELLSIGVEKHQAAFSSGTWLTGTPLTYLAPW